MPSLGGARTVFMSLYTKMQKCLPDKSNVRRSNEERMKFKPIIYSDRALNGEQTWLIPFFSS